MDLQDPMGADVSEWNPFLGVDAAENYARARPDYHPVALAAAARMLGLAAPVALAIDVGGGTGLSTRALRAVADTVVGLDSSQAMLRAAEPRVGVHYARASAEQLPVATGAADLVVAAAAFHWFDQALMLGEAARVLSDTGGLVVYSDFFNGELLGATECSSWLAGAYREQFPSPPRRSHFDVAAADRAGLVFVGAEDLRHDVPMTVETLTDYLLSQSNATTVIDSGRMTMAELRAWLLTELEPRMPTGTVMARFAVKVWCCRKEL